MQICIDGSIQICIDPPRGRGDRIKCASIHRCKFASIPPALRGSMQICIDVPRAGGLDANLHQSPKPLGDR